MSKTKDLTQGHPSKILLMFSLPIFMGNILQQLYSTVDSVIVGQFVGAYSLGAIGTTFPITFMVVSIATGLSNGAAIFIGQSFGGGQVKNLKKNDIGVCNQHHSPFGRADSDMLFYRTVYAECHKGVAADI